MSSLESVASMICHLWCALFMSCTNKTLRQSYWTSQQPTPLGAIELQYSSPSLTISTPAMYIVTHPHI